MLQINIKYIHNIEYIIKVKFCNSFLTLMIYFMLQINIKYIHNIEYYIIIYLFSINFNNLYILLVNYTS